MGFNMSVNKNIYSDNLKNNKWWNQDVKVEMVASQGNSIRREGLL